MKTAFKIIEVTQKHIDNGEIYDVRDCPVARACKASGLRRVMVDGTYVEHGRSAKHAILPKRTQNFIRRFDNRKTVKPFSFRLNLKEA